MTYYDRIRNRNDRSIYESPEEREERFRRLLENQEISEQKELYKYDCYKEKEFKRLLEKLKIPKEKDLYKCECREEEQEVCVTNRHMKS